ncbi:SGNH/GDSL hydrolase family protein [Mesorhizobium sp. M1156]|uniref:SGNH/GDSL hydrolase family protein n=1 Tax=Mesorhizobium sp. M1156 TaxID=2957064 RepID=UPI00333BAE5E
MDRAQTASDVLLADAARDASLYGKAIFPTTAAAIGLGVVATGAIAPGSAGTNGTFPLAFTGGAGSGAAGRFVVAGGILTQIVITAPGSYTVTPTLNFAASAGLTGAAAAAILGSNVDVGEYFWAPITATELALYQVTAGPVATDTGARNVSYLLNSTMLGKSPVVTTAALWTGQVFPIQGPVVDDRTVDRIYFAGAAGTLVLYAAAFVSGSDYRPLRSMQYDVAAGVNDISGKGFYVNAGEYLIAYAPQGIYRITAGGPGVNYLIAAAIGQTGTALVAAGNRVELGFKMTGRIAAEVAADLSATVKSFATGRPQAALAGGTAASAAVWIAPEEPCIIDGYVTSVWAYGTNAGTLDIYIATKNADGTYTATASLLGSAVAAGAVVVKTKLAIAKGQLIIFKHSGQVNYQAGSGGLRWFQLSAAPTTNTAAGTSVTGTNMMFGARIEGAVSAVGTTNEQRITNIETGTVAEVNAAKAPFSTLSGKFGDIAASIATLSALTPLPVTIGKSPAAVTASLWTGGVFVILGPVAEDRTVNTIDFAGAAGTLVVYAAQLVSGSDYKMLRSAQYDVAAGAQNIAGKGFEVNAGEYLIGHAYQGIYRTTSGGPGINYVIAAAIGQTSTALVAAGMRAELGFNLIGRAAADAAVDIIQAIETYDVGRPLAGTVAATAWTGTSWIAPEEPSPFDGFVTEAWAWGEGAGSLEIYVCTKNSDGTYTTTASASFSVGAGLAHVYPNLPIAKGQIRIFRHTGVIHRNASSGGLRYFYLSAAPSVNTAAASSVYGNNLMFGARIEGTVRGRGTANDKRIAVLEGGSNVWAGRKWGALGTSITAGDSWVTSVAANLGMTVTDLGVGGGMLTAWLLAGVPTGGQIMAQIASLPVDCSLVTLEGFTNDIWNGAPLGVYTDKTQGTFYGALWAAYTAIKARAPNALVLCLCDHNSTNEATNGLSQEAQDVNGQGLSPWHYHEAFRISADMAGWPFLAFPGMGMGFFTPELYIDHIHPNSLAEPRIADYVTLKIRGLMPIT